ncbi:hypothetical protein MSHI_16630 [Mycobacterium shinjukuense]|uniref:Uncharacterized protein n=1 Tax=Mycobacterium shinjukuense TaxID=398694 RepID=A0A7I7MPP4_9MYCO|nr:hypothetical protein MSHI_16630 [Mycobacterium shinjukuense]
MLRPGDDATLVCERRGTTPLATLTRDRSTAGCDGPTRSVLLGQAGCSSEGFPVMAGSTPLGRFYRSPAYPNHGGEIPFDHGGGHTIACSDLTPATGGIAGWA